MKEVVFVVEIEIMKECHIEEISKIELKTFSSPWSKGAFETELSNKNSYFIVAKEDERVVGYMGLYNIVGEGYITNIAVLKKYRGRHIGSKLMEKVLIFAKSNNLDFISLEVRASNEIAIKFYEKYKFRKEGIRKNFYILPKEDGFIMTRRF